MKKLFENKGGNVFKLIGEWNDKTTSTVDGARAAVSGFEPSDDYDIDMAGENTSEILFDIENELKNFGWNKKSGKTQDGFVFINPNYPSLDLQVSIGQRTDIIYFYAYTSSSDVNYKINDFETKLNARLNLTDAVKQALTQIYSSFGIS